MIGKMFQLISLLAMFFSVSSYAMEGNNPRARLAEFISKVKVSTVFKKYERDEQGFMHVPIYSHIQGDFCRAVLEANGACVLDIGAGRGYTLARILEQQDPETGFLIQYTAVELLKENMEYLKKVFNGFKKTKKIHLMTACKNMFAFIKEKKDRFDLVFAGFSLHVLGPLDYFLMLNCIYEAMKCGGKLFMTQQSTAPTKFTKEYYPPEYLKEFDSGNIFPFSYAIRGETKQEIGVFMSDPVSMERLLKAVGFKVDLCGLFEDDVAGTRDCISYLGIIATKDPSLSPNKELLLRYLAAAEKNQKSAYLLNE